MNRTLLTVVLAGALALPACAQDVRVSPAPPGGMPVRGGDIVIKVADYAAAREQALSLARREGAELMDGNTVVNEKGKKHGWLKFRLSSERTQALLHSLRTTGKLYSETLNTQENLSEYEDLERRVNRLREHQDRLDALLKSSRRLRGSDILFIQDRLFRAGVDEGMLLQRRLDLERAARTSSLTVTLFEPGALPVTPKEQVNVGAWFQRSVGTAWFAMQRLFARASTAAAYALVFAPLWIPALILAVLLLRRLLPLARRLRRQIQNVLQDLASRRRSDPGADPEPASAV